MKVWLKTRGPLPKLKGRVCLCDLLYIVIAVGESTHLDEETSITECDIQPAGPEGVAVRAELVVKKGEWR